MSIRTNYLKKSLNFVHYAVRYITHLPVRKVTTVLVAPPTILTD